MTGEPFGKIYVFRFTFPLYVYVYVLSFSVVSDSVTPWTTAHQTPLSMELSRQELQRRFAISSSRGSSQPRDKSCVFCIAGRFFTWWAIWEALCYSYRYLKLILRACWDKGSNEGNKMGGGTNEPLSNREELESHTNFLDGLACGSASRNARKMQLKPNS